MLHLQNVGFADFCFDFQVQLLSRHIFVRILNPVSISVIGSLLACFGVEQ